MLFTDIVRNDAGFGNHNFTQIDYVGKFPPIFIYNEEYSKDLRSIVLVSDWETWTTEELHSLDHYGKCFTDGYDMHNKLRLGGNYLHIGVYNDQGDYPSTCRNTYVVKRHSWGEAVYHDTFEDLLSYLDELLVYGM